MRGSAKAQTGRSYILILLAIMFLASGLSRLGLGVAEVLAGETDSGADVPAPASGLPADDPGNLFAALQARKAQLDELEATLDARAQTLREAEAELQRNIAQLETAETRLATTLRLTETAAEDDLTHLTSVFESMKPPQAAELFAQMDTEFAAGFVSRLRPDFAGEVMSALDPLIAYGISAVLAGRHARTPRQ